MFVEAYKPPWVRAHGPYIAPVSPRNRSSGVELTVLRRYNETPICYHQQQTFGLSELYCTA